MDASDYVRCAARIGEALKLQRDEHVLMKLDVRVFTGIVEPLQREIRRAGAVVLAVVLAEDTAQSSEAELELLRRQFKEADVFIWLPEIRQRNRPALEQALVEWLDAKRGRAVHFHWHGGTYPLGSRELPAPEIVDRIYLEALAVAPEELERRHLQAIDLLRVAPIRVVTPDGTNLQFDTGDRPFCSQIGDASPERLRHARTRIDRDIELPAGVLRVAPVETSAHGTIFLDRWKPIFTEGRQLLLHFRNGYLERMEGENSATVLQELTAAGGAARMFREFALGFNPALKIRDDHPFIGYFGYGSGVVRLSLGDNEEMGGANRGGCVYWNFIPNASVYNGNGVKISSPL
jgi:hypothetical protein